MGKVGGEGCDKAVKGGMWEQVYNAARLAQSVERLALNQVVVGSSPTVGASFCLWRIFYNMDSFDIGRCN